LTTPSAACTEFCVDGVTPALKLKTMLKTISTANINLTFKNLLRFLVDANEIVISIALAISADYRQLVWG
jgi:hypothetical protein